MKQPREERVTESSEDWVETDLDMVIDKTNTDSHMGEDTEGCPVQEIILEIDLDSFTKIESAISHHEQFETTTTQHLPKIVIKPHNDRTRTGNVDLILSTATSASRKDGCIVVGDVHVVDKEYHSIAGTIQTIHQSHTKPTNGNTAIDQPVIGTKHINRNGELTERGSMQNLFHPHSGVEANEPSEPNITYEIEVPIYNYEELHSVELEDDPIANVLRKIEAVKKLCPINNVLRNQGQIEMHKPVKKCGKITTKDKDKGEEQYDSLKSGKRKILNPIQNIGEQSETPKRKCVSSKTKMKRKTKEKDERQYNYTEIADPKLPLLKLIARLLNHPETNPHVIEWVDQSAGIFKIKNTMEFAKFRGKKRNGIEFLDFQHINRNIKYH